MQMGNLLRSHAQYQSGIFHVDDHYALALTDLHAGADFQRLRAAKTLGREAEAFRQPAQARISSTMPASTLLT